MNKFIGMGRLTADPIIKESTGDTSTTIARFKLAINRGKDAGADFIPVTAFNKNAEFTRDYLHKGMKILVYGRFATGSYEKDGTRYYTAEIIAESFEFCEAKKQDGDGFAPIDDLNGFSDDGLPFAAPDR